MELGPFNTVIEDNTEIETYGIDKLKRTISGEEEDEEFIQMLTGGDDVDTGERAQTGGRIEIEWNLHICTNKHGIWSISPIHIRSHGAILYEDLPAGIDKYEDGMEFEEFEKSVDTNDDGWHAIIDDNSFSDLKFSSECMVTNVEIDFGSKTISILFD